jgi:hypothetical protein
MEAAMYRNLVIAGTLTLLSGALLSPDSAQAGASASAASKNQRVAIQQQGYQINRTAGRSDFSITEYSSSSARNRQH